MRKYISRLYINDGISGNEYTELARGNGEIKELVSILRRRSFSGEMVLDRSLAETGDLGKASGDFKEKILSSI